MTEKVELENDGQGNMKVDKIITTLFESKQRVEFRRAACVESRCRHQTQESGNSEKCARRPRFELRH